MDILNVRQQNLLVARFLAMAAAEMLQFLLPVFWGPSALSVLTPMSVVDGFGKPLTANAALSTLQWL